MKLDPAFFSNFLLVAAAFAAAFAAALWLSLIIWTFRDIRRRSRDPLLRILAALVVAVLFLPGIIVYLILRPPLTLDEEYQQALEEEALLQSIEDQALCPSCSRKIQPEWVACPNCHTRLKKSCHQCGKPIELPWNICPYCGTSVPGLRHEEDISALSDDFTHNPPPSL